MYHAIKLSGPNNELIGYGIKKGLSDRLHTINIYSKREIEEELDKLNRAALIKANWPAPDDPEVIALLDDASFEPIGPNAPLNGAQVYQRLEKACEVVATQRS